jgi:hypothetical protein
MVFLSFQGAVCLIMASATLPGAQTERRERCRAGEELAWR